MFDATKSLQENLDAFRLVCEDLDADCSGILFGNLALLKNTGDQTKDRAARASFNRAVKAALDALPTAEVSE